LNVIEYGLELKDAVAEPRIHLNGRVVQFEKSPGLTAEELRKMGHSIEVKKSMGYGDPGMYFGGVQAAQLTADDSLIGAPDPRRNGLAVGW